MYFQNTSQTTVILLLLSFLAEQKSQFKTQIICSIGICLCATITIYSPSLFAHVAACSLTCVCRCSCFRVCVCIWKKGGSCLHINRNLCLDWSQSRWILRGGQRRAFREPNLSLHICLWSQRLFVVTWLLYLPFASRMVFRPGASCEMKWETSEDLMILWPVLQRKRIH